MVGLATSHELYVVYYDIDICAKMNLVLFHPSGYCDYRTITDTMNSRIDSWHLKSELLLIPWITIGLKKGWVVNCLDFEWALKSGSPTIKDLVNLVKNH